MGKEYKIVAVVSFRDEKRNFLKGIPIYIDLDDVNREAFLKSEKEMMDRFSQAMAEYFIKKIDEFIKNDKAKFLETQKEKGGV